VENWKLPNWCYMRKCREGTCRGAPQLATPMPRRRSSECQAARPVVDRMCERRQWWISHSVTQHRRNRFFRVKIKHNRCYVLFVRESMPRFLVPADSRLYCCFQAQCSLRCWIESLICSVEHKLWQKCGLSNPNQTTSHILPVLRFIWTTGYNLTTPKTIQDQ